MAGKRVWQYDKYGQRGLNMFTNVLELLNRDAVILEFPPYYSI